MKQIGNRYLPPIEKPIAHCKILVEMVTCREQLSKQANIKFTHITLDVGVARTEFHWQWNQTEYWLKVTHFGKMSCFYGFFGVIGTHITGSALEGSYINYGCVSREHGIIWKALQLLSGITLRKKCPYSELFWFAFSRI